MFLKAKTFLLMIALMWNQGDSVISKKSQLSKNRKTQVAKKAKSTGFNSSSASSGQKIILPQLEEKVTITRYKNSEVKRKLASIKKLEAANLEAAKLSAIKDERVAHAQELLGKHYKKSVVKIGENVSDVRKFIKTKLIDNLKGSAKKQRAKIQKTILAQSAKYHFDPIFLLAMIETESSFNAKATGPFGEIGFMQIKPDTAEWITKKYKIKWRGEKALVDPCYNITIGAAYLDFLRGRFDSHSRLYIAAYNMGATNVHRALDKEIWPKDYPIRVMQHYVQDYTELGESHFLTSGLTADPNSDINLIPGFESKSRNDSSRAPLVGMKPE